LPSAATVSGVPRRSWPNAASGVISRPGEPRPRGDPAEERVVLGRPEGAVEVLDDDDLDAGRAEQPQPLLRVEQQRRRGAEDDLVGVARRT
jgi:hypothetical protein